MQPDGFGHGEKDAYRRREDLPEEEREELPPEYLSDLSVDLTEEELLEPKELEELVEEDF